MYFENIEPVKKVIPAIVIKVFKSHHIIFQTLFELITSEASYLKSLNILISNFLEAPELSDNYLIDKRDKHVLFSNASAVRDVSSR